MGCIDTLSVKKKKKVSLFACQLSFLLIDVKATFNTPEVWL